MRILVTNDDGIRAEGLAVLEEVARELSDDVWTVAPDDNQSAVGRSLSLHMPVTRYKVAEKSVAVRGTPTDCVVVAIKDVMADCPPDLVLSGINRGQNIAEDLTFSGTVAAALMGTQLGVPSIALSLAKGFQEAESLPWDTARDAAPGAIRKLVEAGWPEGVTLNLNIPDVPVGQCKGIRIVEQGRRDHRMVGLDTRPHPRGGRYHWLLYGADKSEPEAGTDLHAVYHGHISVTPLRADLTDRDALDSLRQRL